ncbi:MAG: hypothetical protein Q7T18_05710, partial [Sedimentisphaerales bacterium]|nr:hypothetical protein [Sedimentisphaerales bacterium]
MLEVKTMLATAIHNKASDVHINVGLPPMMRINTEIIPMPYPVVTNDEAKSMVLEMVGPERFARFESKRDYDFATTLTDQSRFRVNAH